MILLWTLLNCLNFAVRADMVHDPPPNLLVLYFNGLGNDLLMEYIDHLSSFKAIASNGVHLTQGLEPVFPSSDCVNMFSLATGLYPESHGITGCQMKDDLYHRSSAFNIKGESDEDATWWDNGQNFPVWTVNELKTPFQRASGGLMWSGSGAEYFKRRITKYMHYNSHTSCLDKVQTLIEWLMDGSRPLNCIFSYFDDLADQMNFTVKHGSTEIPITLSHIDHCLNYLFELIQKNKLSSNLNIIVASGFGSKMIPFNYFIDLNEIISPDKYETFKTGQLWNIAPIPGQFDHVYQSLLNASHEYPFSIRKREELPEHLHYKNGPRVTPIIIFPDEGYVVVKNSSLESPKEVFVSGHWIDSSWVPLRGVFFGVGPTFKRNFSLPHASIIDLYPLMCHILNLDPRPSNGTFKNLSKFLLSEKDEMKSQTVKTIFSHLDASIVGPAILVILVVCIFGYSNSSSKRLDGKQHQN